MKKSRCTEEQIIHALRRKEAGSVGGNRSGARVAKHMTV